MNKAVAAGIGVVIVLIAIAALYMMNQTDESTTQVDLSEDIEITAEDSNHRTRWWQSKKEYQSVINHHNHIE